MRDFHGTACRATLLAVALALFGLCAQVSARVHLPAPVSVMAMDAGMAMDADCMAAMTRASAADEAGPTMLDMTLDCIAKNGCLVVALTVEPVAVLPPDAPPESHRSGWPVSRIVGSDRAPEVEPPIRA